MLHKALLQANKMVTEIPSLKQPQEIMGVHSLRLLKPEAAPSSQMILHEMEPTHAVQGYRASWVSCVGPLPDCGLLLEPPAGPDPLTLG